MKKISRLLLLISSCALAQTGTIKGLVLDEQSENPLAGASIELLNQEVATGTITDFDGRFTLTDLPLGRQRIRINHIGYEDNTIGNIMVTSGKDSYVVVKLLESFNQLNEVVVTNNTNKDKARNGLATVSARQFGLEEVGRFSGGRGDVGRLAANFAGVSSPDDSRNDIVIRGNSPTGLLWRLEGIPIPNPNHFSAFGTTGGPVSAVNSNVLRNSDFITSAFPAEYGNALGGVFDLGFRTGNQDDYEYTAQVGAFTGVEANIEGPMGKNQGAFLLAARYSFVGLVGAGAGGGSAATPNYTDVSFNLNFGKGKLGKFSVFGILGLSDIDFLGDQLDENDLFAAEDEDLFVKSRFAVIGLKHRIKVGNNSYLKTIVATSHAGSESEADRYYDLDTPNERSIPFTQADDSETRFSFSALFNSKLNNRATLRTGLLLENFKVRSLLQTREEQTDTNGDGDPDLVTFRDSDDSFFLWQPYVQGKLRLAETLTLNAGLHVLYSSLSEQFVVEPRMGVNYAFAKGQSLGFGYGMHNQPVPLPLLFLDQNVNGQQVQSNRALDFVQSHHYVLGYDVKLAPSWRGKVEVYYQDISKAAVESFPSSYSSLTEGADFEFDNDRIPLVNGGTGFNQGVELTLEKFFDRGYYGLLTASLFESRYTGSDGIERNTPFNNGYVVNFLTGREYPLGQSKRTSLFFDTRASFAGGRYFTPVDLQASQQAGFEVLQEENAFSQQYDAYFRWDLKFGIKRNSATKKQSHQLYLDIQNLLDRDNVFVQRYNRLTNEVNQVNQVGFFPDFGYRFQF